MMPFCHLFLQMSCIYKCTWCKTVCIHYRVNDWAPILNTIKINKSLEFIAVRSYYTPPSEENGKHMTYIPQGTLPTTPTTPPFKETGNPPHQIHPIPPHHQSLLAPWRTFTLQIASYEICLQFNFILWKNFYPQIHQHHIILGGKLLGRYLHPMQNPSTYFSQIPTPQPQGRMDSHI